MNKVSGSTTAKCFFFLRFFFSIVLFLFCFLFFVNKGAVYTVWIFICICMSLRVFLFAKKMKFWRDSLYFPGLPLALLFYAGAFIGRTDGA